MTASSSPARVVSIAIIPVLTAAFVIRHLFPPAPVSCGEAMELVPDPHRRRHGIGFIGVAAIRAHAEFAGPAAVVWGCRIGLVVALGLLAAPRIAMSRPIAGSVGAA